MKLALRYWGFGIAVSLSIAALTGCAADAGASDLTSEESTSDLTAATRAKLTTDVKALYEASMKAGKADTAPLPGATDVNGSKLRGAAHTAYVGYAENEKSYGYGTPQVMSAMVDGYRVYVVGGIISDTGDELGFYDSRGVALAVAYSGQGENPNANGVDWN